ncbi:MAG: flagellar hook-associated protein FlgK [Syntrophaceae bacterium]|nr:flagellar hook-associated protein FlgK [Syntrophaceae bacterium]
MSGIYQILNTAKEGLLAAQVGMAVTGANVTNAHTPGYVRQRAVMAATSPGAAAGSDIQTGVEVTTIERLYNRFIELQMVEQSSQVGEASIRKETLDRIETIFNETDGGGLNELMNRFWSAWEDLSANPAGQVERTALANAADSLAGMFREYAGELYSIRADCNTQVAAAVGELNGYLADIASLNGKIIEGLSGGVNVNNLLDQRSALLKKAAGLIDIQYVEEAGGAVNVLTSDGRSLVQGIASWQLGVQVRSDGYYDVVYADNPAAPINGTIGGGKLAGLIGMRDTAAKGYQDALDSLAGAMVDAVNTLHASGFDGYRNAGGTFFDPLGATGARDMRVSAAVLGDPNRIAASATVQADGDNARAIAGIRDSILMGGVATLGEFYASLVGQIGRDATEAARREAHETGVMTQMENAWEQTSGVSIDEEMMSLIKYQMSYQAAARLAKAADEILQSLLEMT